MALADSIHFVLIENFELSLPIYLALYLMRDEAKALGDATFGLVARGADTVSAGLSTTSSNIFQNLKVELPAPSSAFARFALAALLGGGIVVAIIFNFLLLSDPMRLVVGEGAWRVFGSTIQRQHFGAAGAIFIEFVIGFFFFEACRITNFFESKIIQSRITRWGLVGGLGLALLALSYVEARLAISREFFIQLDSNVRGATPIPRDLAITVNLILGALMPAFMAFSAMPLEILGKDARHVIALLFGALLFIVAIPFGFVGFLFGWLSKILWALYATIFVAVPSKIVGFVRSLLSRNKSEGG